MKPRSIKAEAAACRKAWAAMPDAVAGVHIHHEVAAELLIEPIERRIAYILANKPEHEQALRLRLMRPITAEARAEYQRVTAPAWAEYRRVVDAAAAEYRRVVDAAWAEYQRARSAAHAAICPTTDCPWDSGSIFGAPHD